MVIARYSFYTHTFMRSSDMKCSLINNNFHCVKCFQLQQIFNQTQLCALVMVTTLGPDCDFVVLLPQNSEIGFCEAELAHSFFFFFFIFLEIEEAATSIVRLEGHGGLKTTCCVCRNDHGHRLKKLKPGAWGRWGAPTKSATDFAYISPDNIRYMGGRLFPGTRRNVSTTGCEGHL